MRAYVFSVIEDMIFIEKVGGHRVRLRVKEHLFRYHA